MLEQGVHMARNLVPPITSVGRKRSLKAGDGYDDACKRRRTVEYSTMSFPVDHSGPGFSSPRRSYGGVDPSIPVSSRYISPSDEKDDETGYNRSDGSQSRSSFIDPNSFINSSYRQLADSSGMYDRSTRASTKLERYGYPSSGTGYTEQGYPGQYDLHEYPYFQEGDAGRRDDEGIPSIMPLHKPPPTKRNRFNLSRYQLDDAEDLFLALAVQSADIEDVKPNRFKTQRERLMQAREEESEESGSTAPESEDTFPSHAAGEDSSSRDSINMSQSERFRQFQDEHSHHVVIPNQWEGEKNLYEFVAFGNIEAALRPLGLMMARAALVNDSVTTRHHRTSSPGPSGCHTNRSNPLQAL